MVRLLALSLIMMLAACDRAAEETTPPAGETPEVTAEEAGKGESAAPAASRFDIYATVRLTSDLAHLTDRQRQMIPLLIEASDIMDALFWRQAWGDREALMASIADPAARRFAEINYGPWDRLDNDAPFIAGVGPKPPGARFYPEDMSKDEFAAWQQPGKDGLYSLVRRDTEGRLQLVPYHEAYAPELERAAALLRQAADLAEPAGARHARSHPSFGLGRDPTPGRPQSGLLRQDGEGDEQFAEYLRMRADALLNDEYQASDMAWMDMKDNPIELVIGPIETYEDRLYGYRAAYESFVLVKDTEWSARLARFAQYLPELQAGLPVPDEYKRETPGAGADLNAYDVIYYAGHGNAGSKTIAINLPNDEEVQLAKGTRRLQLKNAMHAKYDRILLPIAELLIDEAQRRHVTFDSFFGNTMFHEVAHGLGIKNTLDGSNTVRQALKEHASAIEEGKADILGLYMVRKLREKGEITEGELMDDYVTFLAGIFRSVRFGASSAHGQANMIRFNFFRAAGAFSRDDASGRYRVNQPEFERAVEQLSRRLLTLQGDGDYAAVDAFVTGTSGVDAPLQADLDRLAAASIPVDIVFEQGIEVLGL